jgi:DNA replication protein DnaC
MIETKSQSDRMREYSETLAEKNRQSSIRTSTGSEAMRPLPDGFADLDESRIPTATMDFILTQALKGVWPLYLMGPVGRGKSFTAAALYRRWVPGRVAKWTTFVEFSERSIHLSKNGSLGIYVSGHWCEYTRESWWRSIREAALFVVDELGSGTSNEWRNETLWQLLEARKSKPLIMTGNLTLDELRTKFDDRIQSRIAAGTTLNFAGRDMRLDGLATRVGCVAVTA